MPPSSNIEDELSFQQRWEIRRRENEFDSSSEESKSSSSSQPVLKKLKLVSSFASHENDEAIETDRFHQKGKYVPGTGQGKVKFRKAKKIERRRNDNLVNNVMERDSHEEPDRKQNTTSAYDHAAALDDVKTFMESLLEDLKDTRENLFKWMREEMQKLVADDTASKPESRKDRYGRGKNQVQHQFNFEENVQVQRRNNFEETLQVQHLNNFKQTIQMQHQSNFKENSQVRHQNNYEANIVPRRKDLKSGMRDGSSSNNHYQALEDQVEYGKNAGSTASNSRANKKGETRLGSSVMRNFQFGHSVQVQHQNNVVLGLRAQNCNDGSSERSVKGKSTAEFNNCSKVLEGERLGLTANPNSSSNSSNQVASSMYLTLPTVLTQPCAENYRLETSSCNYVHPRTGVNKRDAYSKNAKVMIDSSAYSGCFSDMQQEERLGSFALNQNSTPASRSIGTGLPPLHQGMDGGFNIPSQLGLKNVPKENHNILGLTMNGGAIRFSGGSHALSEQYAANNFHRHSNNIADRGLKGFQISDLQESGMFPK